MATLVAGVAEAREALERLYRDEGPRLQRALILFARDRAIAEDSLAEAFAQAIRRGEGLDSPRAWLWRTAFRIAAGELKQRGRSRPLPTDTATDMPEAAYELIQALARLSPKQRGAVVLRYYGNCSTQEIAKALSSTTSAVSVHLARGRKRLRKFLEVTDE
jgi:RNA polymerase sigma-70 factor, ECF subfamily